MRTNIFFSADWHLGHNNILKYDDRPFRDVKHMHRVLVNNYNSSVRQEDICYFVGDMGICKGDIIKNIVQELQGTKILILGNHDKGKEAMLKAGFDVVLNGVVLVIANERVTISHCPLAGVWREDVTNMRNAVEHECWHGESRHKDKYSMVDLGQFHLHGHIHSVPEEKIFGKK